LDFFTDYDGIDFFGATLGLIGLGRIGGHVAGIARGLGMNVMAYDPYVLPSRAAELDVDLAASLEEVLGAADVLSLHLPLIPETEGMLNARRLAQMKSGSILINTARGGLVDEGALLEALEKGHLYGAGLDVLQVKPVPPDHPLLKRDNVIISPHVAAANRSGKDRLWRTAITHALQVLRGQRPKHLVNPEVWDRMIPRLPRPKRARSE
jgi:D-3-phosphoglycerate dehydrogenase